MNERGREGRRRKNKMCKWEERQEKESGKISKMTITTWSIGLLMKLMVGQLVKKLSAFYGTRRFITVFTRARRSSPQR
jgi:hypothetical protein